MRFRPPIRAFALVSAIATTLPAFAEEACRVEIGEDEAQILVDECLEVTPATHPPCNAENPCTLIEDEIDRGCAMMGEDAPDFCPEE